MRVLCVTSSFPRHADDHAGRFVYELACGLSALGDQVHVLAPDHDGAATEDDWLPARMRVTRVRYAWPRAAQRLFYGSGAPENLSRAKATALLAPLGACALSVAVARHLRDTDVVLAHWLVPAGLAAIVGAAAARADGADVPIVAVAHSGDVHLLSRLVGGARLARAIGRHAQIVAVATDVARRLGTLGVGAEVATLGATLVAPTQTLAQLRSRLGIQAPRVVLGLGRLENVKGYDLLIRAVAGLRVPGEPVALVLAGDGSEREALRALAADLSVELHLCGFVGPELKSSLLHAADVVAFPSRVLRGGRTEGLPIALLEARLAGAPIVASDVGALREGLRPSDCVVPAEDVGALRQALEQRLASCALRSRSSQGALVPRGCDEDATFTLAAAAQRYRHLLTAAARSASVQRRTTAMFPRPFSEIARP